MATNQDLIKKVSLVILSVLLVILLVYLISNYVSNKRILQYEGRIESLLDSITYQNAYILKLRDEVKLSEGRVIMLDSMLNSRVKEYDSLKESYYKEINRVQDLPADEAIQFLKNKLSELN